MPNAPAYTLNDILQFFLAFCSAVIVVTGAIGAIMKWVNKAKEPTTTLVKRMDEQDVKLREHDGQIEDINELLHKDKLAIDKINEGNRVTQSALLAIMEHSLNGDNLSKLEKAKDDLEEFLIKK